MTQWIPLSDGVRLAARIWLPTDADTHPVPAVFEYLPYRRRDGTAARDAVNQPWLARHGYAAIRVDIRGTGDSEGLIADEYDAPELSDGVEIIAWLAAQPWCTGRVGMWGISWGGFNALQIAARRPPALRAIIPMGFTHDRYDGDCHFMGGCLLEGNISWGNTFFAGCARPPDPAVVGPAWRERWLERLNALQPPIGRWLAHQRRDDYWKPGSICEDWSQITAAVYAVSGWQDSYARNVLPLLENLHAPCKALIGPWAHAWPHMAAPGPRIGFLTEALRWWDHWLLDIDTGIMDEPRLRVWMGAWTTPAKYVAEWPGHWVTEPAWPPDRPDTILPFGPLGRIASPQTTGLAAGYQNSYGLGPDLSDDQRHDDAASLCVDLPLDAPLDILGAPSVTLELTSTHPQALLAVRLCEVETDGASLRISYGLLNLSHRDGPADPTPLIPGQRTRVTIPLCATAHRFTPGHRLRLALSTTYWPIAWPAPQPVEITVHDATLHLPVRPSVQETPPAFAPPETAPTSPVIPTRHRPIDAPQDRIETAPDGTVTVLRDRDRGAWHATDTDVTYDATGLLRFAIHPHNPLSARQDFTLTTTLGRAGWHTRTEASSELTCTETHFILRSRLTAFDDETEVFKREWKEVFKRHSI